MSFSSQVASLRNGQSPEFSGDAKTLDYAQSLDSQDPIGHLRHEFILPTKTSIQKTALTGSIPGKDTLTEGGWWPG